MHWGMYANVGSLPSLGIEVLYRDLKWSFHTQRFKLGSEIVAPSELMTSMGIFFLINLLEVSQGIFGIFGVLSTGLFSPHMSV